MNNVPSLGKGVKDVKVDLPKKEVTVVYDSTKNSDDNIVKGFASIKVKAEPKKPTRRNNAGGFCYRKGRTILSSLLFRLLGGLLYCRRFPPIRPVYRCGCPFVFITLCLRLRR